MNSLKVQIAVLALGISLFAALAASFLPHYVYEARDALFLMSLNQLDQAELQSLMNRHGMCSPIVQKFRLERGYIWWDINFTGIKFVIAGLVAIVCAWLATRYAGRIIRPIQQLSAATELIRQGQSEIAFPETKAPSEIANLSANFSRMNDWLKASNADLKLRSRGIAHEIRTPLAVMRARLIGVQEKVYTANGELVAGLLRQIELIDQLTTDVSLLLDTAGSSEVLEIGRVDIKEICDAVAYSLQPMAESAGIDIMAHGQSVTASVDAGKLERAIANLVRNAIQHAACKHIALTTELRRDGLAIICEDDGNGWPITPPEKLLTAFVTGENSLGEAFGRTGLGLALVNAITKAHRGILTLETSPMGGAKATITLP